MKIVSILGSTGSIGVQSIAVCKRLGIKISALAAHSNITLLEAQIRELKPAVAAVFDERKAAELKIKVADTDTKIVSGIDGLCEAAEEKSSTMVITAVVGMIGILPTITAIKAGKDIALANKETLVCAGSIITRLAKEHGVKILPVDSEHSAIFQCLQTCSGVNNPKIVKKLLLTASGGPFFGYTRDMLKNKTKYEALKHPNWSMGAKISIDSATLCNKGLEFIEAFWLFSVTPQQIEIVVHPQSIVHSMVEFCDNSVVAQLGSPDMAVPISYAMTYPDRAPTSAAPLDFTSLSCLNFFKPDTDTFSLLALCKDAIQTGGTLPAAVNAANEEAVALFLEEKISFLGLFSLVEQTIKEYKPIINYTLDDIFDTEKNMRHIVRKKAAGANFKE